MGKTYIRVDAESRQNRLGQMGKWEDMDPNAEKRDDTPIDILREQHPQRKNESDEDYEERLKQYGSKPREYWSEASIRERLPKEQYPQLEGEKDDEYEARLAYIGKKAFDAASIIISDGKRCYPDYETTESTDKGERVVYRGHRFEELEPDIDLLGQYNELFRETREERWGRILKGAISDTEEARSNLEKFPVRVSAPNIYESQQNFARHYIGALNYKERALKRGIFDGFGENRYTRNDADHLEQVKKQIVLSEREQDYLALATGAKMLEGLFCPFVLGGFFDSAGKKEHAGIIVPSEFDDIVGKVDAAVILPIAYKNKEGQRTVKRMPICFDLTTAKGAGKAKNIADDFQKRHGYAGIKYPSSCTGRAMEALDDVPHFAICIDSAPFRVFTSKVASGSEIPQDLQYMINIQIQRQAALARDYWKGQKGKEESAEEKEKEMAFLASYFKFRSDRNLELTQMAADSLDLKYHDSLRYLNRLKNKNA